MSVFPSDYWQARDRFRQAAQSLACVLETHPIKALGPQDQSLSMDVARYGSKSPQITLILSSGLHGVEGYCGSAIQVATLTELLPNLTLPKGVAVLLIHALNPYGFAWNRRCNEDNIDLNRNFLLPGQAFAGSPDAYAQLDAFLNPRQPPNPRDSYLLKLLGYTVRYGVSSLKQTLPVGQYDFPQGIFFGGQAPAQTQRILATQLPNWLAQTQQVLHLDLHTGLGRWTAPTFLVKPQADQKDLPWFQQTFTAEGLQILGQQGATYVCQGDIGPWCQALMSDCDYRFATVEFGTYPLLPVLKAIRAENQAHWWDQPTSSTYQWAKSLLLEANAPSRLAWRQIVVTQGVALVHQALEGLNGSSHT
ncbi:DUF2817 domain-containing protein [Acaryochloris sp. IP29b_bin.137]|uniref:DUF2817 domain-containing protein n=1 Tax=Acaryochloris sp. IP29b_bin.137 TaxID=2969217 RepID=UPI0026187A56|nr:DUF2817 domain-containing protein [Acaryochloris sp. IP29b_bin.137]